MKGSNILKEKVFRFGVRTFNLYKYLVEEKQEFVISKQLLRSGTSIGANRSESEYAESDADFIHKLSIARKEASESLFWIELLYETKLLTPSEYTSIKTDCEEIIKLLTSIIKSMKSSSNASN